MKRLVLVACAATAVGCLGSSLRYWRPDEGVGVVESLMCQVCSSPYDYQVEEAENLMSRKCGGRYKVVEEGDRDGPQEFYYSSGGGFKADQKSAEGGYSTSAGTSRARYHYWSFRCGAY